MRILLFFPLIAILHVTQYPALATFSPAFRTFLTAKYGLAAEKELSRHDVFPPGHGSFGGGHHVAGQPTRRRPVVFVHGMDTVAGDYTANREYFMNNSYLKEELYATTYGGGNRSILDGSSMLCRHVKAVRLLIMAVHAFTGNSSVDVVAYSMGSPIARKAILGGRCVDTGEELGRPLTDTIQTFVGACGANFGAAYLCLLPVLNPTCNRVTGLDCDSRFLRDVNAEGNYANGHSYEGQAVYTIYSRRDEVVGYRACGGRSELASRIPHERRAYVFDRFFHSDVIYNSIDLQFALVARDQRQSSKHGA